MSQRKRSKASSLSDLPDIPGKLYFTIGEVSRLCDLKPHVLRYWEQEFSQLSPSKRRGNRRYYQRKDVLLIREIKGLLYGQGYTIEGARQKLLRDRAEKSKVKVVEAAESSATVSDSVSSDSVPVSSNTIADRQWAQQAVAQLERVVVQLRDSGAS